MPLATDPSLIEQFLAFVADNETWVVPIVFLLGFAESLVLVSVFVPSSVLFLGIGAAHSAADGPFLPVWFAGSLGAIAGDVISFAVGRYLKRDLQKVWPISKMPRLLARSRLMFSRYGYAAIIIGKFMGNLRPFLPIAAGALRMRWHIFLPASVVSSLIWAGVFLAPGYGVMAMWQ